MFSPYIFKPIRNITYRGNQHKKANRLPLQRPFSTRLTANMPRFQDRVCLITGASSGLGRQIALQYASHGARYVLIADLNEEPRGGDVDQACDIPTHKLIQQEFGTHAGFARCNVSDEASVEAAVAQAIEEGGTDRLDVIVNNAGLGEPAGSPRIDSLSLEAWERTMSVNMRGVFLGTKHALKQMITQDLHYLTQRRGHVVNVSSMLGYVGVAGGTAAYCASKGGVLNMTRQVAIDYAKDRIHVNALCPGFTKTAMTRPNFENSEVDQTMRATTPWGEWGEAEEVARGAVFLASEDAAWVTGVGLPVDGGYLAQ